MTIGRIHGLPLGVMASWPNRRSNEFDLGPSVFGYLLGVIRRYIRRRNEQMAMAELSDHLLRDIGMTRAEAAWRPDFRITP